MNEIVRTTSVLNCGLGGPQVLVKTPVQTTRGRLWRKIRHWCSRAGSSFWSLVARYPESKTLAYHRYYTAVSAMEYLFGGKVEQALKLLRFVTDSRSESLELIVSTESTLAPLFKRSPDSLGAFTHEFHSLNLWIEGLQQRVSHAEAALAQERFLRAEPVSRNEAATQTEIISVPKVVEPPKMILEAFDAAPDDPEFEQDSLPRFTDEGDLTSLEFRPVGRPPVRPRTLGNLRKWTINSLKSVAKQIRFWGPVRPVRTECAPAPVVKDEKLVKPPLTAFDVATAPDKSFDALCALQRNGGPVKHRPVVPPGCPTAGLSSSSRKRRKPIKSETGTIFIPVQTYSGNYGVDLAAATALIMQHPGCSIGESIQAVSDLLRKRRSGKSSDSDFV